MELLIVFLISVISYLIYEVYYLRLKIKKIHHSFASPLSRMMMITPILKSKVDKSADQEFHLLERSIEDLLFKMKDLKE